jgi:signal peptidase I
MSNILYHNSSKEYGYFPCIGLRIVLVIPTLFIPFIPSTPDSLISILNLVYPLILLEIINLLYQKKKKLAIDKSFKFTPVIIAVLIFASVAFTLLVSNQLDYGALVIATESMTGELNKGDFVIFEKIDNNDELKEGMIIVYQKDDSYIVHRLVGIENIDYEDRYYTKGDANENDDTGYITRSDIVGVTQFKISYIGYPTLWLRELFD